MIVDQSITWKNHYQYHTHYTHPHTPHHIHTTTHTQTPQHTQTHAPHTHTHHTSHIFSAEQRLLQHERQTHSSLCWKRSLSHWTTFSSSLGTDVIGILLMCMWTLVQCPDMKSAQTFCTLSLSTPSQAQRQLSWTVLIINSFNNNRHLACLTWDSPKCLSFVF